MNYTIDTVLESNEDFSSFLKMKIREFNNKHSIHHKKSRQQGAIQPIHLIVTDDDGKWIGGIAAEVYWNWVEINDFWLNPNFRGNGLGRLLLQKVEDIAYKKGATKVLLTTFDFQAKTFYELHGYVVVGEVKDYPPGSSYYTMVKSLNHLKNDY